ncbi:hypothetical protein HDK64DRAFT_115806 [Phyllosticta capitalensis]
MSRKGTSNTISYTRRRCFAFFFAVRCPRHHCPLVSFLPYHFLFTFLSPRPCRPRDELFLMSAAPLRFPGRSQNRFMHPPSVRRPVICFVLVSLDAPLHMPRSRRARARSPHSASSNASFSTPCPACLPALHLSSSWPRARHHRRILLASPAASRRVLKVSAGERIRSLARDSYKHTALRTWHCNNATSDASSPHLQRKKAAVQKIHQQRRGDISLVNRAGYYYPGPPPPPPASSGRRPACRALHPVISSRPVRRLAPSSSRIALRPLARPRFSP